MTKKTQVGREQGRTLGKTTINLKLIARLRWAGNKVMTRIVGGTQMRGGDTESQDMGNQTEAKKIYIKDQHMKHKPRTMAVPLSMGWLPDVPK